MKLFRLVNLLFFVLLSFNANSQEPEYKSYNWGEKPVLHQISANEATFSSIILKENRIIEYAYDSNNQLVSYNLIHKIIKANNDEGVAKNNRIFLPFSASTNLIVTKARVIDSKGTIKELRETDIKEGVNNETRTTYRYFALEGLDVGSEIEYILVFQQDAEFYGRLYQLQDDENKRNVEFTIFSPSNLVFSTKCYNNLPEFSMSTASGERNKLYLKMDTIAGVKSEQFALYTPNLMQFVVKLSENKDKGKANIINYMNAASTIGEMINETVSKKAEKGLDKIIKAAVTDKSNTENIVRSLENYIKKNFEVEEHVPAEYKQLENVLEYKNTDAIGITKLYVAIFKKLKIDYQVVLTTNRYEARFDPKFEAYNFLDKYLIYLPAIKDYICPEAAGFRLGLMPYQFFNNYGLFVKTVKIGNFTNYVGEIKLIEPLPFDATKHNHIVDVDFTQSLETPVFKYELLLEGYYAQPFQPYYSFVTPDQKKELDDFILKNMLSGVTVTDYSMENTGIENLAVKPFIIKATSSASSTIINKAGNKYLFKIGELIGPQVEMYQDEERKFDVENDFNRSYYRELSFTLPTGFKVNNLDALNMKVELLENGKATSYFTSEYQLVGENKVVVKVNEDYKTIFYPKARFQEYRKVINAAADFNKIVLVIEKK